MASVGSYISGLGHVGLIGWLIVGWGFDAEPIEIETMDISVISGEAFDQMRAGATPDPSDTDPIAPTTPQIDDVAPVTPAPVNPQLVPPSPSVPAPSIPQAPDVVDIATPTPPQAPTVASSITAPPPPRAIVDEVVREDIAVNDTAQSDVITQEQEASAPEETTTQIVIDDLAPRTSLRPSTRPSRPSLPDPAQITTQADDVAAALADVLAQIDEPNLPIGPPMTGLEQDRFRVAVNRCWNVDPGSVAARVTVEVGFSLSQDGRVIGNEVRLLSSNGDQAATSTAFGAARRAVLRCQSAGYDLPAEKYEQWKEVAITFDPSGMRLR